ncbi:MAG: hypothetical protein AVDCRST_MAG53-699, partial [uncultured Solirubrobacteraceae bacterium]
AGDHRLRRDGPGDLGRHDHARQRGGLLARSRPRPRRGLRTV